MATFFIADLHLGEERYTQASRTSGSKRPFADAEEMGRAIASRWNEVVSPEDIVWVLGDIGRRDQVDVVRALHGQKRLVGGNCDDLRFWSAQDVFRSLHVAKKVGRLLLTHLPVHPGQLGGRGLNVHGHLHAASVPDQRYICVSADRLDFRPVQLPAAFGVTA